MTIHPVPVEQSTLVHPKPLLRINEFVADFHLGISVCLCVCDFFEHICMDGGTIHIIITKQYIFKTTAIRNHNVSL